uniref:Golgin subfamily A member 4 n=1 Tax=Lygus hesperus TaxID=30085 RepID=A0A0A9Z9C2_LYGHE
MSYLLAKPEFKAAPVVKKPWDDVQEPEPVTYFWLMQPLYGISGEDEEFTGLKSTAEYPGETATTNELVNGRRTSGSSSVKRGSHITTKESKTTIPITDEIQSLNDEHEEVDIENKEENEEQEPTRKHENADPLMVGLLHTSNLANEQRILEQLHNELFRLDPELQKGFEESND